MKTRKPYVAPVIVNYGSVKVLTRAADAKNSDMSQGNPGTAYSV